MGRGKSSFPCLCVCWKDQRVAWAGCELTSTGRKQWGSSAATLGCLSSLPTPPLSDLLSFSVHCSPGRMTGQVGAAGMGTAVAEGNIPNVAIYQHHGLILA